MCHRRSSSSNKGLQTVLWLLVYVSSTFATLTPPCPKREAAGGGAERVLSRKRRYVAFPDGSSLAVSVTKKDKNKEKKASESSKYRYKR